MVAGKAGRDALFLSHFTALHLTVIDTATTIAVAIAVWTQLRLNARLSMRLVLVLWPLAFALGDLVLWAGLSLSASRPLVPIAFVWIGGQACFIGPHAALIAKRLLTAREARRRCDLIGAGAILGWMAGGLMTRVVATYAGATMLLFADGILTGLCSVVAWFVWRHGGREATPPTLSQVRSVPGLRHSAAMVWTSPHLRALACLAFVAAAVTTIAALQFRAIASESIRDTNQLAAFFGSFSVRAGALALAFQLLVTTRVLERLGIGAALAIAPAALGAASIGLWYLGTLTAATFLRGADQTLRYSIDRSAVDIVSRPLSDREVLGGKTFIDGLVSRFGDTAGATMALVGTTMLHMRVQSLAVMSVMLVVAWFAGTVVVRRQYCARLLEILQLSPRAETVAGPGARGRARTGAILDPDPRVRLATLRTLTHARSRRRKNPCDTASLAMALGAEIVGFAMVVERAAQATGPHEMQRDGREAIERIARLLFLSAPRRYPSCLFSALDADGHLDPAALDYLETNLDAAHRQLLVSSLERWNAVA